MDHGFSEVISKAKVFELNEKFFKLPFQATKCKLAGESESHRHQVNMNKSIILKRKEQKKKLALSFLSPSHVSHML